MVLVNVDNKYEKQLSLKTTNLAVPNILIRLYSSDSWYQISTQKYKSLQRDYIKLKHLFNNNDSFCLPGPAVLHHEGMRSCLAIVLQSLLHLHSREEVCTLHNIVNISCI